LGVAREATFKAVKAAYLRLCIANHPRRHCTTEEGGGDLLQALIVFQRACDCLGKIYYEKIVLLPGEEDGDVGGDGGDSSFSHYNNNCYDEFVVPIGGGGGGGGAGGGCRDDVPALRSLGQFQPIANFPSFDVDVLRRGSDQRHPTGSSSDYEHDYYDDEYTLREDEYGDYVSTSSDESWCRSIIGVSVGGCDMDPARSNNVDGGGSVNPASYSSVSSSSEESSDSSSSSCTSSSGYSTSSYSRRHGRHNHDFSSYYYGTSSCYSSSMTFDPSVPSGYSSPPTTAQSSNASSARSRRRRFNSSSTDSSFLAGVGDSGSFCEDVDLRFDDPYELFERLCTDKYGEFYASELFEDRTTLSTVAASSASTASKGPAGGKHQQSAAFSMKMRASLLRFRFIFVWEGILSKMGLSSAESGKDYYL
jgi:hypothetical protein